MSKGLFFFSKFSALEKYMLTSFYLKYYFVFYLILITHTYKHTQTFCLSVIQYFPCTTCSSFFPLCLCGSATVTQSQWSWAKVTSKSTANTTVIACCPPRPTRVGLGKATEEWETEGERTRGACEQIHERRRQEHVGEREEYKCEIAEQTEGRQTSSVRQNLCQWVRKRRVGRLARLLRLWWVTEVVPWQGCTL